MTNQEFRTEVLTELQSILSFWVENTADSKNGGFIGRIDGYGNVKNNASKGVILNTRILWTFSRACNFYKTEQYIETCHEAYAYLKKYFNDVVHGGLSWAVSASGEPVARKKQIYAQAFGIYALSEYYKFTKKEEALEWAFELFHFIEKHANDKNERGYLEAFSESWSSIEDLRLSEKDHNEPKTANTHLHILEAYTTLLEVSGNEVVENRLQELLNLFLERILDEKTNHLGLFFTLDWKETSGEISYGHDIETGWLLLHAAKIIGDDTVIEKTKKTLNAIAETFVKEGLDEDFGVLNNKTLENGVDTDKHWWAQAEAIVGLLYAWRITDKAYYLENAKKIWSFTKKNIFDLKNGEWFFRVDKGGFPYMEENKVGPWKCPYHNGRAMIEVAILLAEPE